MSEQQGPVTVEAMNGLIEKIFAKREEIAKQKEVVTKLNAELEALEQQGLQALKDLKQDNFRSPQGTLYRINNWRVKVPVTEEAKQAFFAHLKERGIIWKYVTVNSQSLNSLFKEDFQLAVERGEGMEFKMPGIEPPSLFETVGLKKA